MVIKIRTIAEMVIAKRISRLALGAWIGETDKYVPSKDYKAYTAQLKKVYGAPSLKAAEAEFERFKQAWSQYLGAIDIWNRNWQYVEQLFQYGSAVRKIMYTTNAIESVNFSFWKVTKKVLFLAKMP